MTTERTCYHGWLKPQLLHLENTTHSLPRVPGAGRCFPMAHSLAVTVSARLTQGPGFPAGRSPEEAPTHRDRSLRKTARQASPREKPKLFILSAARRLPYVCISQDSRIFYF